MSRIAKKHTDMLSELKDCVEDWHGYWKDNSIRYNEFTRMVFQTALTPNMREKLTDLQKPQLEFNIMEAMISRLRGEFAKQEPSLNIRAADGITTQMLTPELLKTIEVVEAHLRAIFFDAASDSFEYTTYSDVLAGGFSVAEVYTDYVNEMTFEQSIKVERAFDPCLCFFDPMARLSHKGDGNYCGQMYPRTRDEFIEEFGAEGLDGSKFTRSTNSGYNWSYKNGTKDIVLVGYFYKKKRRKTKIVKLSTGRTVTMDDYNKVLEIWAERGITAQPPIILPGYERTTYREYIVRYTFCENQVLDVQETNYTMLPLVFIDGNSVLIKETKDGSTQQMTRPYVYNAKSTQDLKNYAGQTIAAEIENMVQHKWMAAVESIPEDYLEAYQNPQQASVLLYNGFLNRDPANPIPPPQAIQRTQTPAIVQDAFYGADKTIQLVLGSYDAQLGQVGESGGSVSGKAIQQGAMHSDAASVPYLVGYIKGLQRIGEIILDLIPKYYVTPRSLPILKLDGKRDYIPINEDQNPDSIYMNYDSNVLQLKVEAGVNSSVAKQMAMDQLIKLMGTSELFNDFMNREGLDVFLSNMDIRGIEDIKVKAADYMKSLKEKAEADANKPDPMQEMVQGQMQIEMAGIEQRREKAEGDQAVAVARVANEQSRTDIEYMRLAKEVHDADISAAMKQQEAHAKQSQEALDTALKIVESNRENSNVEVDI